MEQSPKQSPAEAVLDELMDRSLLNGVDDDLHLEIVEAIVKAVLSSSDFPAPAAVEPVADLIEPVAWMNKHGAVTSFEHGAKMWGNAGYELSPLYSAASLSQLSTKLENAERERDEAKGKLASFGLHVLTTLRNKPHSEIDLEIEAEAWRRDAEMWEARAESAKQERDELRAKLADAREAAFEEAAQIAMEMDGENTKSFSLVRLAEPYDPKTYIGAKPLGVSIADAIRARAVKGAGQS